jgi:hypothetical protein
MRVAQARNGSAHLAAADPALTGGWPVNDVAPRTPGDLLTPVLRQQNYPTGLITIPGSWYGSGRPAASASL